MENKPKKTPVKKAVKGAGDVIHLVTNYLNIEQCDACMERQATLNRLFPFTTKAKVMTADEIEFIQRVRSVSAIGYEDRNYLFQMYNRVLTNTLVSCDCPSIVIQLREDIWNVYLANHSTNINEQ